MTSSSNLLNLVSQLQSMEMSFTSILMEAAMKLSAITDANIFVLVETPDGRKISGKRHLCDAYMSGNLTPTGQDVEFEVNPLITALQERHARLPDTYTGAAVFPSASSVPRSSVPSSQASSASMNPFKSSKLNTPIRDIRLANGFPRKRPGEQPRTFHSNFKLFKPSPSAETSAESSQFAEEEMVSVNIKEENDTLVLDEDIEDRLVCNADGGDGDERSDHDDDVGIISDLVAVGEMIFGLTFEREGL